MDRRSLLKRALGFLGMAAAAPAVAAKVAAPPSVAPWIPPVAGVRYVMIMDQITGKAGMYAYETTAKDTVKVVKVEEMVQRQSSNPYFQLFEGFEYHGT